MTKQEKTEQKKALRVNTNFSLWEDFCTFFPLHVGIIIGFGAIFGGFYLPEGALSLEARIIWVIVGSIALVGSIWRFNKVMKDGS